MKIVKRTKINVYPLTIDCSFKGCSDKAHISWSSWYPDAGESGKGDYGDTGKIMAYCCDAHDSAVADAMNGWWEITTIDSVLCDHCGKPQIVRGRG